MKHFNRHKTAYGVQEDRGVRWYLVGEGKIPGISDFSLPTAPIMDPAVMDELTEVDRQMLLEAEREHLLYKVWRLLEPVLKERFNTRDQERRLKAKRLFDKYQD